MKSDNPDYLIRETRPDEAGELYELVKKLAEYEKLLPEVTASPEMFQQSGFGEHPYFKSLLVENAPGETPRFLGFALYFFTFSTFVGKPTLYLEDLFVLPEYRGQGIGMALLTELGRIALQKNCGRMEWFVLDWNESAIGFYRKIGAVAMDEWTVYRLTAGEIRGLVARE